VRIAKSSKEQDGYERHRTRPVPVSLARAHSAPERHFPVAMEKLAKSILVSRGVKKKFSDACRPGSIQT